MHKRTLLLVRHAKSSWKDRTLPDTERPLAGRGRRAAPKMGKRLAKRGLRPDIILSSPATRALQTARILATALEYPRASILADPRLYGAEAGKLLAVIRKLDAKLRRVMLCGHNPELVELAQRFSPSIDHMPTCAVAELQFKARTWAAVSPTTLIKARVDLPNKA